MKACLVCPIVVQYQKPISINNRMTEAEGLALAIDLDVVSCEAIKIKEIKPATFFSRGILENLKNTLLATQAELVIVDASLSSIQQRNLENELNLKVIDRTALILEIFGERAQTSEGKLQVELAHLTYQRSRLVRSWTHLERQRGGAGFLGGPGEKQIEIDRRIIDDKIVKIKKELEKVKNTRALQRGKRRKVPYPVVALVGYTNAGKSTLFNFVSGSSVLAEDMLFATLDPTMRKFTLPSGRAAIISDTVGFISDLPHELIMSFRSTLEEVLAADIIVHVRDITNPDTDLQRKDVLEVLHNLGLKDIECSENYIEALNKTDLLNETDKNILLQKLANQTKAIISLSALTGQGCKDLLALVDGKLSSNFKTYRLRVRTADGKLQAWLYENSEVISREEDDEHTIFVIKVNPVNAERLRKIFNISLA